MPPSNNAKRLRELHITAALRLDFEHLLLNFCGGDDLSFAQFKTLWKTGNLGNIHHCKSEKIGYKAYLQLVYEAVLVVLQNELSEENAILSSLQPLQLISDSTARRSVWNVGVIYCLYTVYHTQLVSQQDPIGIPVHIGLEVAMTLSAAVQRLSTLAEFGRSAVAMHQAMLKSNAFRYCAYTGPTSLFYCQRAAKKAPSQTAGGIMADLVESGNRLATTSFAESSSSSSSRRSTIGSSQAISTVVTDAAAVQAIRQVYSVRPLPTPPVRSDLVITDSAPAQLQATEVAGSELETAPQVVDPANSAIGAPSSAEPAVLDVTKYLTQSIAERRQKRADKAKERQMLHDELEAARVQKLRVRVLKRLEKHDAVNDIASLPVPVEKPATKRGPRRTHAIRLREEAAQQEELLGDAERPGHSARQSSAQFTVGAPAAPARQRTRASSRDLAEASTAPRLVPTGRHVAEARASQDVYLQENDSLMEDFEEFVGLRPKTSRSTASTHLSAGSGRVRRTRNARVEEEEEPEVHLDAATGDIMEILRQLEQDSQRVLEKSAPSRALRSNTASAPAIQATSAALRSRPAPRTSAVMSAVASRAAPASHRPSALPAGHSAPLQSAGLGGPGGLELREVGKKRRAVTPVTQATVLPKRARVAMRRAAAVEEAPLAEDDIMGMLQRLERESDRILASGGQEVVEENESSDSEAEEETLTRPAPPMRRRDLQTGRKKNNNVEAAPMAGIKPRAAQKQRAASSSASTAADSTAPLLKKSRVQASLAAVSRVEEVVDAPMSAESSDIMALLQRLERESDQILGGEAPSPSATTSTGPSAVTVASESTLAPVVSAKKRPRIASGKERQPPQEPAAASPPIAKAPRKAPATSLKAASKGSVSAKATTAKQKKSTSTSCSTSNKEFTIDASVQHGSASAGVDTAQESCAHATDVPRSELASSSGDGMDIMDMLRQLEDEANGILSAQK